MSEDKPAYGEAKYKQKWEHRVCSDEVPASPEIAKLEQHGWELVTVVYKEPIFYFYFKREKQNIND